MITVLLDILEHAAPPPVPNEVRKGGRKEVVYTVLLSYRL
jgi:hypothetical protein